MKRLIWDSRSSAFLYIYHYVFFLLVAVGLNYWNPIYSVVPLIGLVAFIIDAKSMKYEVTDEKVRFSPSLFDKESAVVPLKDIVGFYVVDEPPWSWFSLGTVLLITDLNASEQPCIKCIKIQKSLLS